MTTLKKPFKTALNLFSATEVTLGLFALLVCVLVPTTFFAAPASSLFIPAKIILALIGLNLAVCTLSRLKSLRAATLLIHLGSVVILAGALIDTLGFVSTVNIYEGTSTDTVFRWDIKKDVALGFDLRVTGINSEFYPIGVKVGVLKDGKKVDLFVTREGDSFVVEGHRVRVAALDLPARDLQLAVQSQDDGSITTISTSGRHELPPGFPLDFKLVAFQDPQVKRIWVDLELRKKGELVAAGTAEVNHPLNWQGRQFFLTKVTTDAFDRSYAGIQISKAPGIPYVYSGFVILCLGLLLSLKRWNKIVRESVTEHRQSD